MFCTQCGKQIPDDSKFCPGCGARVPSVGPKREQTQPDSTYRYVPPRDTAKEVLHGSSGVQGPQGTSRPDPKPQSPPRPDPKPQTPPRPDPKPQSTPRPATSTATTDAAPKKSGCLTKLLILAVVIVAIVCNRTGLSIPQLIDVVKRGEPLKERAMYDLQMALDDRDTSLVIRAKNWDYDICPWTDVGNYVLDYLRATPELFYVDMRNTGIAMTDMDGKPVCRVKISYLDDLTTDEARIRMEVAADNILDSIPYASNDWEKALYIHDALIRHVTYEEGERDQTAYGALVDGKAVCMGYAMAYEYLLTRAGIQADTVCGYSDAFSAAFDGTILQMPGHAWTVLTVTENGREKSCFVDTTWDDFDEQDIYGRDYISYNWFGVTLEEMQKAGRSTEEMGYDMSRWDLDNEELNYFVHYNAVIDHYNLEWVASIMQNQMFRGNNLLTVRMADQNTLEETRYYMEEAGDMQKLAQMLGIEEYAYSFSYDYLGKEPKAFHIYLNYPNQ